MTNKQTEEVIKEFRKQFTLDPARVFFGDPEELRKQGWEVGKSRLIINQSATPEEIETFILTAIKEAEERGRERDIIVLNAMSLECIDEDKFDIETLDEARKRITELLEEESK